MKRSKQDRELTDEERNVVVAVRHCSGELNDILQGARRKAQSNSGVFAESGVSVLFRGLESYADMYEKLSVKTREGLGRLFTKFKDREEVRDAEDAIEETEGNWRDFLRNLDREFQHESVLGGETHTIGKHSGECKYFITAQFPLIDIQSNREITLGDFVCRHTCVFVTFQPAYCPDTIVRWRHSEITKVQADLTQFRVGFVVVTWGPPELVRAWSKQLHKAVNWPILWDKSNTICSRLGFRAGLEFVWAAENLDFLGCQRAMHNRTVNPPATDLNWLKWNQIGGEAVISRPVRWDPKVVQPTSVKPESAVPESRKRRHDADEEEDGQEESEEANDTCDFEKQAARDEEAIRSGETKVCMLHISSHLTDLAPSGSIYQAALTCYARSYNTTEAVVMDQIRQSRRFSTAPESTRLQYEANSGLYYDPETLLYYDASRGYFYDDTTHMYYYWSQSEHRYIPANTLIHAEIANAQATQIAQAQAEVARAAAEREAARQAVQLVAAQLAEIRSTKDDYAAYVYATCVAPQQEQFTNVCAGGPASFAAAAAAGGVGTAVYPITAAAASNIESSLRAWDQKIPEPLVPYADDPSETVSDTPPPPGL